MRLWVSWVLMLVMVVHFAPVRAADDRWTVLPLASAEPRIAAERTAARADAILRSQACGNEPEFVKLRAELEDGQREHQGEGFTTILIAKIHWLRTTTGPCEDRFVVRSPEEPETIDPEEARLRADAFRKRFFDDERWRDASINCSARTSRSEVRVLTNNKKSVYELTVSFRAERDCLRQQVNQAIRLMEQDRRMGTETPLPVCPTAPFENQSADFDMTVKEVVRILYLSGAVAGDHTVLDADTVAHMFRKLLPARGGVGPAMFGMVSDCADSAGEALGTPVDYADDQDLGGDVEEFFLEDAPKWLFNLFTKVVAIVASIYTAGVVAAAGFLVVNLAGMDVPVANLVNGPLDIHVPETENHRLMIESSRFLTNRAIILDLRRRGGHENLEELLEQQREVREFLLKDLQRITIHDFDEYNARPYTRLSLDAITNLYDFANDGEADSDPQLQAAARIVLDLSAAKFAAGSSRGRRIVPYRRLAEHDGSGTPDRNLYTEISGADNEVLRHVVLAGQTQPMEWVEQGPTDDNREAAEVRVGAHIGLRTAANMLNIATSTYRLPVPIMEVATERAAPFTQVVHHAGLEIYYNHPALTMSVGGVPRPPALGGAFGLAKFPNDSGVAMPTTLIPTLRGTVVKQTFQFQGEDTGDDRIANTCGWKGFICGIKPVFADMCALEDKQADGSILRFFNSAKPLHPVKDGQPCRAEDTLIAPGQFRPARRPGPHFFLAAKTKSCRDSDFCPDDEEYGVMEMVAKTTDEAFSEDAFRQFREARRAALLAWRPLGDGNGTYRTEAGDTIEFRVMESGNGSDDRHSRLWKVNGALPYAGGPLTNGAVINQSASVPRGKASITSPWSLARIDIDFSDWRSPRITDVPAPGGIRSHLYQVSANGRVTSRTHWRALSNPTDVPIHEPRKVSNDNDKSLDWTRFVRIMPVLGSSVVYAMDAGGELWWLRHEGIREGSDRWLGPKHIGTGWTMFDMIVAGENGLIYGRKPDGTLRWYRHLGHGDGINNWAEPRDVDTGWEQYINIFAGSDGVLYGVTPDGNLDWRRHDGYKTGASEWERARRVGTGWNTVTVHSAGRSAFYVITKDGELRWYRHLGDDEGEFKWEGPEVLGHGWVGFTHAFVLRPE